ncbi:MAG: penicillin-binding protein 2 [Oscillospiraceae bacterium]|nr:penicillin-binding protein 2 [Oscillospiraceae bacterium]
MNKRVVAVFFTFTFFVGATILRLLTLISGEYARAGAVNSTLSVEAGTSRGFIYDCEMRPLLNEQQYRVAVARPTEQAVAALQKALDKKTFEYAYRRLSKGYPVAVTVPKDIDCPDIIMLSAVRRYSENQTLAHLIGYQSGSGEAVCGLEKSFDELLRDGNRVCSVTYTVDARGRVLVGEPAKVSYNGYYSPAGVCLTIDREIQKIAEDALNKHKLECGAIVVLDVETGAIKALASAPGFDAANPAESLGDGNSPFLNRTLNAFSVGSVFKIVVAAAALESGVSKSFTYECTGSIEKSGVTFHCHERGGHGKQDMRDGMKNSCNTYFIELAQQFKAEEIIELAYYMGFGGRIELAGGIVSDKGVLPDAESLDSAAAVANISFGQGKLTATPLQIAGATLCVASGGVYRQPYLVKSLIDSGGMPYNVTEPPFSQRVISEKTAETLREFLTYTLESSSLKGPKKTDAGGKTATSQSGVYKDGREQLNTWYSGFFPAEKPKYVITVLKEKGASGTYDCQPVFNEVADKIEKMGKIKN